MAESKGCQRTAPSNEDAGVTTALFWGLSLFRLLKCKNGHKESLRPTARVMLPSFSKSSSIPSHHPSPMLCKHVSLVFSPVCVFSLCCLHSGFLPILFISITFAISSDLTTSVFKRCPCLHFCGPSAVWVSISTQLISCKINILQSLPINSPIFLPSHLNIALASRQPFLTATLNNHW